MKICLGTANFKKGYGINKYKHNKKSINKILTLAKIKKIKLLDTAVDYNNNDMLSKTKDFDVITKLKKLRVYKKEQIKNKIKQQLKHFYSKKKKLYGVLLHDCNDMRSKKSKYIFECLMDLKRQKVTDKIGISCYYENDLNILKTYNFDIIQFPFNLFDQRILKKKNLLKIKNKEVHVRSIFLQGILLKNNLENHKFFKRWSSRFKKFNIFIKENKITRLEASLIFLKQFKFFKYAIVGLENRNQLNDVINTINSKKKYDIKFSKLKSNNEKLLIPFNWKT